jgi:uncharacterized protein (DUF2141 family)
MAGGDRRAAELDIVKLIKGNARILFGSSIAEGIETFPNIRFRKEVAMTKIVVAFASAIVLSAGNIVFSQETFTVSGDVLYSKEANIYVCLHTIQTFPAWKKSLPPGSFTQTVNTASSGKSNFKFEHVPKGEYLITAFVDKNGNGRLDCDNWGFPQEPFWTYKENPMPGFGTNWSDQKFQVNENVSGIVIK